MPYNALIRLFRTEYELSFLSTSPHSSTTSPPWTITTATERTESAYARAAASFSFDQPAFSSDATRRHDLPGSVFDWALATPNVATEAARSASIRTGANRTHAILPSTQVVPAESSETR